jgi:transaldolase
MTQTQFLGHAGPMRRDVSGYLARVKAETSSRFWINNPTIEEADLAIAAGAVGSTTNPAFMSSLLRRAPTEILPVIREHLYASGDDRVIADHVQLGLVTRLARTFEEVHRTSGGRLGLVSIQGAPATDHDPDTIFREALEARQARPNVVPKIPATAAGLDVLEALAARGEPCIVTEVFSLDQLAATCERHAAASLTRDPSLLFISPITGIFGDHLRVVASDGSVDIDERVTARAGVVLARACQRMVDERGYRVTLLAGGARSTTDLTDLIGHGMHATINYSTVVELERLDRLVVESIDDAEDLSVVAALTDAFESVRIALQPGSLPEDAFASFPPVLYFRRVFAEGWDATLDAIAAERDSLQVPLAAPRVAEA